MIKMANVIKHGVVQLNAILTKECREKLTEIMKAKKLNNISEGLDYAIRLAHAKIKEVAK